MGVTVKYPEELRYSEIFGDKECLVRVLLTWTPTLRYVKGGSA
jgi:hypothetical protein